MYFGVPATVINSCEVTRDWTKTRTLISKALSPWKKPKHFGKFQEPVHVCMGVMLQQNILEIELPSLTRSATSMLPAKSLLRCAASPALLLTFLTVCMHACMHRPLQRVDAVGLQRQAHADAR